MKKTFKVLLTLLFLAWGLCVIQTLKSCSLDPFSRDKWSNTYLWFDPQDLQSVYVSGKANIETSQEIFNGTDYKVDWTKTQNGEYTLTFTSFHHPVHFAWFTGYDAKNESEKINWVKNGNTFSLVSSKLLPPEDGMYMISMSEDLQR